MSHEMENQKRDAEEFLNKQIEKLDEEQKEKLSYVLLGATMYGSIIGGDDKKARPGKEN